MKKILLVTSAYTGAGHKSISDSLTEQFAGMSGIEVQVVDGFELMGRTGIRLSGIYGFLTRHAPALYNTFWKITMAHPPRFTLEALFCEHRFMDCVRRFRPDLILTVHSVFNAMLTGILKKHGLEIPVVVFQADLADIHSTWCNPDAYMTICPTREAYDASVSQGISPEKLKIMGFPDRSRFCEAAQSAEAKKEAPSRPLRCLLMSGGEGSGRLRDYAGSVLRNTDAVLTVVCGRNKKLYRRLQETLGRQYGERVNILGFVPDVEQVMLHSDLVITRGSPNTLAEAVTMNLPVIMTGPLLGQEKSNPLLMRKYHLGIICESPADAPQVICGLADSNAARLREILAAQQALRRYDVARNIAAYVAELAASLPGRSPDSVKQVRT